MPQGANMAFMAGERTTTDETKIYHINVWCDWIWMTYNSCWRIIWYVSRKKIRIMCNVVLWILSLNRAQPHIQALLSIIPCVEIKIAQTKICIGHIQLTISCCALSLIRILTCLKRALKCTACIEFKLKISEPEHCSSFISKIQYYTLKSPKIKVLGFTFIYTFSFRNILKFGL